MNWFCPLLKFHSKWTIHIMPLCVCFFLINIMSDTDSYAAVVSCCHYWEFHNTHLPLIPLIHIQHPLMYIRVNMNNAIINICVLDFESKYAIFLTVSPVHRMTEPRQVYTNLQKILPTNCDMHLTTSIWVPRNSTSSSLLKMHCAFPSLFLGIGKGIM